MLACLLLLTTLVLAAHAIKFPDFSLWHDGVDQARYLDAARAWAAFDLSPARHHYLPVYPWLGAAFVWLTPWQPFLLPDLVCLLASLVIFVRIGRRLAPGWPDGVFAICFCVAVLSGKWMFFWLWVVPWTSTASAPLQFGALLLALRLGERLSSGRAFALGGCIALAAGVRPSDAAVLAAGCGAFAACVLARDRAGTGAWARIGGAGTLGVIVGALPWVGAHAAIFGASAGAYLQKSAAIGFEWRLLPMRFVSLVIDPRPMLPEGNGMAEVLPWVMPGLAGMILGILPGRGRPLAAALLVSGTVALHWALYLTYRDLQPYGLWRFTNVHYFKWTFPFLVLWAAQFLAAAAKPRDRPRAAAAAVLTLALFVWRPVLRQPVLRQPGLRQPAPAAVAGAGHAASLPLGLSPLDAALVLPLSGSWRALYFGPFVLQEAGRRFDNTSDFKVLPVPGGALLLPLRELPPGPATLDLPADVGLGSPGSARRMTQAIEFGVPCGIFPHRPDCTAWPK